jgi:hypothetical protein
MVALSGITIALVTDFLSAGLMKTGSLAFQKALRIRKVDAAFKGALSTNETVKRALSDLQTVLGTYRGELNTELNGFLEELVSSGLVSAIVDSCLFEGEIEGIWICFKNLHEKMISQNKSETKALFDSIRGAIKETAMAAFKDRAMADLLIGINKNQVERLIKIDQQLQTFNKKVLEQKTDLNLTIEKISKAQNALVRDIKIETVKSGLKHIEISKIYIPPSLRLRNGASTLTLLNNLNQFAKTNTKVPDHIVDIRQHEEIERVTYGELLRGINKTVILGDPGGGKSSLCQLVCYELSKNALNKSKHGENLPKGARRIPIRVVLRAFEAARNKEPQLSIFEFIVRDLLNHCNANEQEIREAVELVFSLGKSLIAFDGLDEILETSRRREYVDLVSSFSDQFPLCSILVTSRVVGYDAAPLPNDFETLVLEQFDENSIREYVRRFMIHVAGSNASTAAKEAADFMAQTERNAGDLRSNPLMLALMSWLYSVKKDVPGNRPEIYRDCAVLMFERWDLDRSIRADIPQDFDRLQLFGMLAQKIFTNPEFAEGVDSLWLVNQTAAFLSELYEDKPKAHAAARKLKDFIVGRAWVMCEKGESKFAFTHQTFLEYFFAYNLEQETDGAGDLLSKLLPSIHRREWDVVANLALHIKTYRHPRRQDEVIKNLTKLISDESDKSRSNVLINFSARTLEYIPASEPVLRQFLEIIWAKGTVGKEHSDLAILGKLALCSNISKERKDFIGDFIVEKVSSVVLSGDSKFASCISAMIANNGLEPDGPDGFKICQTLKVPEIVSSRIKAKCQDLILANSKRDWLYARLSYSWYGKIESEILNKFGPCVLVASNQSNFLGLDGLSVLALSSSAKYSAIVNDHYQREESAKKTLCLLADYSKSDQIEIEPRYKIRFSDHEFSELPLDFWIELIDANKSNGRLVLGLVVALLISRKYSAEASKNSKKNGNNTSKNKDVAIRKQQEIDHLALKDRLLRSTTLRKSGEVADIKRMFDLFLPTIFH